MNETWSLPDSRVRCPSWRSPTCQLKRWTTSPRGGCWTLMSRTKRATRRIHGSWAQKVLNKFEKNAFHCSILIWQVQKWPLRGQGRGPPWLVEDLETRVPHLDKACEEVSLRSSNEHADIVHSLIISYGKLPFEYTYWKGSMINRLSNLINRNRSAAKISQVLCSRVHSLCR